MWNVAGVRSDHPPLTMAEDSPLTALEKQVAKKKRMLELAQELQAVEQQLNTTSTTPARAGAAPQAQLFNTNDQSSAGGGGGGGGGASAETCLKKPKSTREFVAHQALPAPLNGLFVYRTWRRIRFPCPGHHVHRRTHQQPRRRGRRRGRGARASRGQQRADGAASPRRSGSHSLRGPAASPSAPRCSPPSRTKTYVRPCSRRGAASSPRSRRTRRL